MKYGLGMCLIATCLVCPAHADLVDFENAEDYGGDDAVVTADYFASYGLQVTAYAGSNAASATEAVLAFERTDRDGTDAFWSSGSGRDVAFSGDLGNYFLKAGTGDLSYNNAKYFNMAIEYDQATAAASGEVWDIDGPEQYKVTAFDSNGTELASITSPVGGLNAEPWSWSFDMGADVISQINVEFVGSSNLRGFAFDNFNATGANGDAKGHAAPVPPAVALGLAGLSGSAWMRRRRKARESLTS